MEVVRTVDGKELITHLTRDEYFSADKTIDEMRSELNENEYLLEWDRDTITIYFKETMMMLNKYELGFYLRLWPEDFYTILREKSDEKLRNLLKSKHKTFFEPDFSDVLNTLEGMSIIYTLKEKDPDKVQLYLHTHPDALEHAVQNNDPVAIKLKDALNLLNYEWTDFIKQNFDKNEIKNYKFVLRQYFLEFISKHEKIMTLTRYELTYRSKKYNTSYYKPRKATIYKGVLK